MNSGYFLYMLELVLTRWISTMIRAALILGPMALVFWIWRPRWIEGFRIPQPREVRPIVMREIPRTIWGLSVYMLPLMTLIWLKQTLGYSPMYLDMDEYGLPYFIATILIFMVFTDTWFYWAHRLMHSQKILRKCHSVHHQSYNPNPATAYSFDLVESLINMTPYFILVLTIPWHPLALLIFGTFGIFFVGYIHLGYDFGFEWRQRHPVLKWIYSSTHHSIHHQRYEGNYAVYFTFWDKWMKTEILPTPQKPCASMGPVSTS